MGNQRSNGHTVSKLTVHLVWSTKYRYSVLQGDIQLRCREILRQICEAEDIVILKGVVSKEHIHMHINYLPSQSVSGIVKRLKGRSSRKLQQEFPELKKLSQSGNFWAKGYLVVSGSNPPPAEFLDDFIQKNRRPSGITGT